jgi:ubiquinone/menaquinone biosynthesis C-methylase UbiE
MGLADVYDQNAAYWDSWLYRIAYHRAYVVLIESLAREGILGRPLRVLDCGIGAGLFSEALFDTADWQFELHGVDVSSRLLALAKRKFNRLGVQSRLVLGDIINLPYRGCEMDLVLSALVLEHVPQLKAVSEMTRVLRHGRPLIVVATRTGAPDHFFRLKYKYRPYRSEAIVSWLKEAGLMDVRCSELSGIASLFARAYVGVKA